MFKSFINLIEKRPKLFLITILLILSVIYFFFFLTPSKMIGGSDWLLSGYANQLSWVKHFKTNLRVPMWDRYNFCGQPTVSARGAGILYLPQLIIYTLMPLDLLHLGFTILYIIHYNSIVTRCMGLRSDQKNHPSCNIQ